MMKRKRILKIKVMRMKMKNKNNSQRVKTLDEKVRDRERRYSQNIRRTTEEKEKEDKLTINK